MPHRKGLAQMSLMLSLLLGSGAALGLEAVVPRTTWAQTDLERQADDAYQAGTSYFQAQQWPQAQAAFLEALTLYRQLGNTQQVAYVSEYLGTVYRLQGDYLQALQYHKDNLSLYRQLGNRAGEANTLGHIGIVYQKLSNYPEALRFYNEGLALHRELGDRIGEANTLGNIGIVYQRLSNYPGALRFLNESLAIKRELGDRASEAITLSNIGIVYQRLSNYPEALRFLNESLAISHELGNRANKAGTLVAIGIVYRNLSNYPEALRLFNDSLALSRELGDRANEAITLGNIGIVYEELSNYPEALRFYDDSLAIKRELGDRAGEASTLGNIGIVYQRLSNYPEALRFYNDSLAIKRELGDRAGEASILNNIGILYQNLSNYPEALRFYNDSLALAGELGDRAGGAITLGNIGIVYQRLSNYPEALRFFNDGLVLHRELGNRAGEAATLGNIGNVYQRLSNYPEALRFFNDGLVLDRELGNRVGEAKALGNIGNVYRRLSNYPEALRFYNDSLTLMRELGDRAGEAKALGNIGLVYQKLSNYPEALRFFNDSLALSRELGDRAGEAFNLDNIGDLLSAQDEPELATIFFKAAVKQYEAIRRDNLDLDQDLQDSYTGSIEGTYRSLADLLLEQGRIPEAQQVLDLLKLEELREFTRASWDGQTLRHTPIEQPVVTAHGSLIALGLEIYDCKQRRCPRSELNALRAQQQPLIDDYEEKVANFQSIIEDEDRSDSLFQDPNSLSDDAAALLEANPNAALIYPFVTDTKLWILWAAPGGAIGTVETDLDQGDLSTTIQEFGALIGRRGDLDQLQQKSQQLYTWIIEPMEAELQKNGIEHLIFVNDRVTRYIPMAALFDGEQYLVERYTLSTVIAPAITDTEATLGPTDQADILGLGLSQARSGFSPLPGVDLELDAIVRNPGNDPIGVFDGDTLLNEDFTLKALQDNVEYRRILHIATHAKFEPSEAEASFLLLGDGQRMRITEIDAMKERLRDLHLVVLSACQTAFGGQGADGTEINGISSYFLAANRAESVMATLWQVSDTGTSRFMQRFYALLGTGDVTKADALRQAQLSLLKNENNLDERMDELELTRFTLQTIDGPAPTTAEGLSHPYYWAPFILIGNAR